MTDVNNNLFKSLVIFNLFIVILAVFAPPPESCRKQAFCG